jgi:hypothetical protein
MRSDAAEPRVPIGRNSLPEHRFLSSAEGLRERLKRGRLVSGMGIDAGGEVGGSPGLFVADAAALPPRPERADPDHRLRG